eukprot:CAMPEP_0202721418 /NCGR_PEP_ID=MMETSP1385-20130828/148708_1 /ASSEMBLY_ACC=CAM_ASM_000861 /TAXON_ID=933848 /ORGANISM="Elphidium margaritaceum" /LENGTH=1151 /DNA_ID=CAMNT_0049385633 /DNA_START=173 /DNA_END=3625 /DNA_ORIENTATION=+
MRTELCPFGMSDKECIVWPDKDLMHEALNGVIDCDASKYSQSDKSLRMHFFLGTFESKSCEPRNIVRVLCKEPPRTTSKSELDKYLRNTRFLFIQPETTPASRKHKYSHLFNSLATPTLEFKPVVGWKDSASQFELDNDFESFLDNYLSQNYNTGLNFGMSTKQTDFEQVKTLQKTVTDSAVSILTAAEALYEQAYRCTSVKCERQSGGLLYYDEAGIAQFELGLSGACMKKMHQCNEEQFIADQGKMNQWSPGKFAFVEVESAFRIEYSAPWKKQRSENSFEGIPKEYAPNDNLQLKKFINRGTANLNSKYVFPFEWKKFSERKLDGADRYGFRSSPTEKLDDDQRVMFQGPSVSSGWMSIVGTDIDKLQIVTQRGENTVVQPILPPLSRIEITWIAYNWRLCSVKGFGAQKSVIMHTPSYNVIMFNEPTQLNRDEGVFTIDINSAFARPLGRTYSMPSKTELRLYPNCGDGEGKSEDGKKSGDTLCDYIWFYDANRLNNDEIDEFEGNTYRPTIDDQYKYLLLTAFETRRTLKLGILAHPNLGSKATFTVNFGLETNDWYNLYMAPNPTVIASKDIPKANDYPVTIKFPAVNRNKGKSIMPNSNTCFFLQLTKSKIFDANSITTVYVRPIIIPTEKTIKRWKQQKLIDAASDPCTAGFTLTDEKLAFRGLMQFGGADLKQSGIAKGLQFDKFCVRWKLSGVYAVLYEIGATDWYRYQHFIGWDATKINYFKDESVLENEESASSVQVQLRLLRHKFDKHSQCYTLEKEKEAKTLFVQEAYLLPKDRRLLYVTVDEASDVSFEIRKFPPPLKIGTTTDWIVMHVSRRPFRGEFKIIPFCKQEKKLTFEFEKSTQQFYELIGIMEGGEEDGVVESDGDEDSGDLQSFEFKFKITAPSDLKCYGNYPYQIQWKVEQVQFDSKNDKLNQPPSVFLMVIAEDFDSFGVHSTANNKEANEEGSGPESAYDDGLSDPACVKKYELRKVDEEEETDKGGINGLLAPDLKQMSKELTSGTQTLSSGGDTSDTMEGIRVDKTIQNPAELAEFLKDHEKLTQIVCSKEPWREICGGSGNKDDKTKMNENMNATTTELMSENDKIKPKKLPFWAWQNCVVYAACLVNIIGLLRACGCFQKSIEQEIMEAQARAMAPLNDMA